MDNTSGHGQFSVVPDEIKKWSWAGFFLTWIWGVFNGVYVSLFALIPGVNIIVGIYLGIKGNELAWRNHSWYDVEQFQKSQKKWSIAAWIISLLLIAGIAGREVEEYKEAKATYELANKAIDILKKDESANEFMGSNYSLKFNVGRSGALMGSGEEYTQYDFVLQSEKGTFYISCELKNNTEIEKIKARKFVSNDVKEEMITINID